MKKILAALTVPIPFAFMWLGAWLMSGLTFQDWQHFPAFFTTYLLCVGSVIVAIIANISAWSK